MDINEVFAGQYLKATDLKGRTIKAIIESVERGDESVDGKPVMHFVGKEKGMVLNKTNAHVLADSFGPETDNWNGKEVKLFSARVTFQGKMTDGLRIEAVEEYVPGADKEEEPDF